MNSNLNTMTDRLLLDQEDYLREARQRSLVREVKAARTPKVKAKATPTVRRHAVRTRLSQVLYI